MPVLSRLAASSAKGYGMYGLIPPYSINYLVVAGGGGSGGGFYADSGGGGAGGLRSTVTASGGTP